jgi:hypothetical protein
MAIDLSSNSIEIFSSRERIRVQLIDYAQTYLELNKVDLYKTSFVSYIINVLSILGANQLYYTSSIYREFFMTEAQMPESVYNLAKWIGYTPESAYPAQADVLITFPLDFVNNDVQFSFPQGFQIKASDIIYTIGSPSEAAAFTVKTDTSEIQTTLDEMAAADIVLKAYQNKAITVRNNRSGYFYPVAYNRDNRTASVLLPFTQYDTQEFNFSVPETLEFYQFWSIKVDYEGMDWKVEVYRENDGGGYTFADDTLKYDKLEQAEANSIYTMTSDEEKYVWIATLNKGEIFFGNGIIGKQPEQGKRIKVIVYVTKGEGGQVIPNALTNPDRVYYQGVDVDLQPKLFLVKMTTTNPSAATGGSDSPPINEIKSKAIANLRSKERFVSESDYDDFEYIVTDTPLSSVKPVLKRSDLKINEIEVFSKMVYDDQIVPTRNIPITLDATTPLIIPDRWVVNVDDEYYETLFTIDCDIFTDQAEYQYVVRDVTLMPTLQANSEYAQYCYIIMSDINCVRDGYAIDITANVTNIQDKIPVDTFQCFVTTGWDAARYAMTAEFDTEPVPNLMDFTYKLTNYLDIPPGNFRLFFEIYGGVPDQYLPISEQTGSPTHYGLKLISTYYTYITVRKDLSNFMLSSITGDSTSVYVVHNVPVVKKIYMDSIDRSLFEAIVIQKYITNVEMNTKRMLTDFINIKFSDTTGKLKNMRYNLPNLKVVATMSRTSMPIAPDLGYRFIINGEEQTSYVDHKGKIAEWNGSSYDLYTPFVNDYVYVEDQEIKVIWTGCHWMEPIFDIPFIIEATVTRTSTSAITIAALIDKIKAALIEYFTPLFGLDATIDKSEIVKVIRGVPEVLFVTLHQPEVDLRFTYAIPNDLAQIDLLDYTPELVASTSDNIIINVIDK